MLVPFVITETLLIPFVFAKETISGKSFRKKRFPA